MLQLWWWRGGVCVLLADQSKDIYHKEFPSIANIPRRLLTVGPKGLEEHNVSSTKQNRQWMTWVTLVRPSDAEPPLLSGRSPAETADCGLFKQQRVTLKELPCSQTKCLFPVFLGTKQNILILDDECSYSIGKGILNISSEGHFISWLYFARTLLRMRPHSQNALAQNFVPSLTDIQNRCSSAAAARAWNIKPEPHLTLCHWCFYI
jgi:hypothetical protein